MGLAAPVLLHLALSDTFRESMSVSPMDMDVDADLILGWDWISSHDLHHLYAAGRVSLQSGPAPLQQDLLPVSARPLVHTACHTLSVIGHGEFRLLFRQIEPTTLTPPDPVTLSPPTQPPLATLRRSTGWSRELHANHAEFAATEAAALQPARLRRRPGRTEAPAQFRTEEAPLLKGKLLALCDYIRHQFRTETSIQNRGGATAGRKTFSNLNIEDD